MGLKLEQIVPWGRSLAEYCQMFNLTSTELAKQILDCGGGPSSFTAELTQQGAKVVSCDPIYQFSVEQIEQRIQATYPLIVEGLAANLDSYIWQEISSPVELGEIRLKAMRQFLADFPSGLNDGRYQEAALPQLPFGDRQFDLALCSHLLFTYSDQLSPEFHLAAIQELCRVATEVRIFPLLTTSGEASPALPSLLHDLTERGYRAHIVSVNYEFQKGANQMLQINQIS
jgi:hypothetical protein